MASRFSSFAGLGVAALAVACAAYEETPPPQQEQMAEVGGCEASSCSAGHASLAGTGPTSRAGETGGGGAAPVASAGHGGGGSANAGSAGKASGGSGGKPPTGVAGAAGSLSTGGSTPSAPLQMWTFDQGVDGWAVRDQSPELSVALTPASGAVRLVDVPFSAAKQFVDVAYTFAKAADLRGHTLRATLQRTAGGFVGAQLYAYGGAWAGASFESLTSGNVTVVTLAIDSVTDGGFTPDKITRIGFKLGTGSNTANTFSATSVELTEVSVD